MKKQKRMTLAEAQAKFPIGTAVWYFPIRCDEDLKRPSWVRSEPWALGHGEVVLKIEGQAGGVLAEHLQLRETGEMHIPDSLKAPNIVEQLASDAVRTGFGCMEVSAAGVKRIDPDLLRQVADVESAEHGKPLAGDVELGAASTTILFAWYALKDYGIASDTIQAGIRQLGDRVKQLEASAAPVIYQYSATINTARGTVSYDGIVERPRFIRSIEDYQEIRQQIAVDGGAADANAVNILNLSVAGGALYEALAAKAE